MRKIFVVASLIFVLLISFLGITYSYEYNENNSLKFELIGPYEIDLEINSIYYEHGVKVIRDGIDISDSVLINSSMLDVNKVGEYRIKYEIIVDGHTEYIQRIVNVYEKISPEIQLLGNNIIYLYVNEKYIEPGYEAYDNYDGNITNKVITTSNLVVDRPGEYEIVYQVLDSSGNESIAVRKIIVR